MDVGYALRGNHPAATRHPSQEGTCAPRPPSTPVLIPSVEGCPRRGGVVSRAVRGVPPSKPSKAPLFRGGCLRRGGGCTRAVRGVPPSKPFVSDI
ncbi:MAG: hypothetical protein LBM98_11585 [Oscillospiraceae bacterium]|nr:hypothetical protein [Oscillospiraceae bacterium]